MVRPNHEKPDRGIFEEALKQANVAPHESMHVGDSVDNDFFGAERLGIRALLINRGYHGNVATSIDSLTKIVDLVDNINKGA